MRILKFPTERIAQGVKEPVWPTGLYYVSEARRLLYCPIQKVACCSLKLWWAELDGRQPDEFLTPNPHGDPIVNHRLLNEHFALRYRTHLGREPLRRGNWFRFVFVRNPWARLVSAFLNKFVVPQPLVRPVMQAVHQRWRYRTARRLTSVVLGDRFNQPPQEERLLDSLWPVVKGANAWYDELTFRHFVEYLESADVDASQVDVHWRPQYRFLADTDFHFVGRFERLAEDLATISGLIGAKVLLPAANRTHYVPKFDAAESFADCPLRRLRQLEGMPGYKQFYTPQLKKAVAKLYRRDIEQFGYTFESYATGAGAQRPLARAA
jgi:hypothetical protein